MSEGESEAAPDLEPRAEVPPELGAERSAELEPHPQDRPPPAWPVYVITVLLGPISIWALVTITAGVAAGIAAYRTLEGGGSFASCMPAEELCFGNEAEYVLGTLFDDKLLLLVLGVAINCTMFGATALILASRHRSAALPVQHRWLRLRIAEPNPKDMALAMIGLIALTSALDAAIQLLSLENYGRLAEMREVIKALGPAGRIALSVPIAIGAGAGEELYFRGFMLTRLELAHRRWIALAVTSIVFGAFHWDVIHSPLAAIMGLYLGSVVLLSGSLWTGIAAHIANNLCATMLAGLEIPDAAAVAILAAGLLIPALTIRALARRHAGEARGPVW